MTTTGAITSIIIVRQDKQYDEQLWCNMQHDITGAEGIIFNVTMRNTEYQSSVVRFCPTHLAEFVDKALAELGGIEACDKARAGLIRTTPETRKEERARRRVPQTRGRHAPAGSRG